MFFWDVRIKAFEGIHDLGNNNFYLSDGHQSPSVKLI